MTVPDARLDPDGLGWRVSGDEVDVRGDETIALEVGGGADHDGLGLGVEVHDVSWAIARQTEPAALADREVRDARVLALHGASGVDDAPRPKRVGLSATEEAAIV